MSITKDKLLELGIQKRNQELDLTWQELFDKFDANQYFKDAERYRSWVKNQVIRKQNIKLDCQDENNKLFKESFQINKDGSQSSSKLIRLSAEQKKSPKYLLEAHGFDPNEWDLITAQASEWTGYSKQDGQFPQYASKITVKPKVNNFSFDMLEEWIKNTKPIIDIKINKTNLEDKRMLEIPLFDAHFGISDYEYYKNTQEKIYTKITSRKWKEILFIVGQDMIHNNDHHGRTANGTQIQTIDMEKAWDDCRNFYEPLIAASIDNSNRVKIIYSKGNHDETISWAFVKFLSARFPQVEVDDSFVERKAHVFGKNFIGITHGDKGRKNLHNIFPIEFPLDWANAVNREIHMGHLHTEDAKDVFGMIIRTLATRNKTDKWHSDQGFVGSHKRFMLFEYSEEALESIHYV